MTNAAKKFLCVKDEVKRCAVQCWQCKHIEEFEECGQPEDDSVEDTNVEDSNAR